MKPWTAPFIALTFTAIQYVAITSAWDAGFAASTAKQRDFQERHDAFMRGIGTCQWADLMAKDIMCQQGPKPPPPAWREPGKPA